MELKLAESDRIRWDQSYTVRGAIVEVAPSWLEELESYLPRMGRALDIAAGSGRVALWLAARGLETAAVDISTAGLRLARQAARAAGLRVQSIPMDLETEPLPGGPFDLVSCFRYGQRSLFPLIIERLAPGGVLIAEAATVANLERHAHPSLKYLAEHGELQLDCAPLEIVTTGKDGSRIRRWPGWWP